MPKLFIKKTLKVFLSLEMINILVSAKRLEVDKNKRCFKYKSPINLNERKNPIDLKDILYFFQLYNSLININLSVLLFFINILLTFINIQLNVYKKKRYLFSNADWLKHEKTGKPSFR